MDQLTGDVAKDLEEMFASSMILSTIALAGRYSEGGGREEDIPYWSFIWVAVMGGVGWLHSRLPLNLKLNCCFALLTSNRKSLRRDWNIRVELI